MSADEQCGRVSRATAWKAVGWLARKSRVHVTSLPTPDTPENWDAASHGYADEVAPVMWAYADELVDRLDVEVEFISHDLGDREFR